MGWLFPSADECRHGNRADAPGAERVWIEDDDALSEHDRVCSGAQYVGHAGMLRFRVICCLTCKDVIE